MDPTLARAWARASAGSTTTVRIRALKSRPELNGSIGSLASYDERKQRFAVEVPGEAKSVLLKPDNLEVVDITDEEEGEDGPELELENNASDSDSEGLQLEENPVQQVEENADDSDDGICLEDNLNEEEEEEEGLCLEENAPADDDDDDDDDGLALEDNGEGDDDDDDGLALEDNGEGDDGDDEGLALEDNGEGDDGDDEGLALEDNEDSDDDDGLMIEDNPDDADDDDEDMGDALELEDNGAEDNGGMTLDTGDAGATEEISTDDMMGGDGSASGVGGMFGMLASGPYGEPTIGGASYGGVPVSASEGGLAEALRSLNPSAPGTMGIGADGTPVDAERFLIPEAKAKLQGASLHTCMCMCDAHRA